MPSPSALSVILATGGTIAGTASNAADHVGYTAAQLGVQALVDAVPELAGLPLEAEQVAQVDSKDMSHAVWQHLARRVQHHLAREAVGGLVVTHGTDTLEETAWFLQQLLNPAKPVVLTAAMRPATARLADGPQNLLDAVAVARDGRPGVWVALQGQVFGAAQVSKRQPYRLQAFDGGEAGACGAVEQGRVRWWQRPESPPARSLLAAMPHDVRDAVLNLDAAQWPRVEIVLNHAGADGAMVRAAQQAGARGLVVAGTGNGTVSAGLTAALQQAQAAGLVAWRCSRCAEGVVVEGDLPDPALPPAVPLAAVKARVALLLHLLARDAAARA